MTPISKNMYVDKLDDLINKYNNKYHKRIKMNSADVKSNTYINSNKEVNDKNPKFKVGDIVKIWKYKNIFAKDCVPNWSEEIFVIKKLKTVCHGHMWSVVLMAKKLLERFMKKYYKKLIKKGLKLKN